MQKHTKENRTGGSKRQDIPEEESKQEVRILPLSFNTTTHKA